MFKKKFITLFLIISVIFPGIVYAQLADTPWPKFHHDIRNTGKTNNFGTKTGRLKWKFVTNAAVTSSPVLDDNNTVYIGSADNNFYAIDAETGAIKWHYLTEAAIEHATAAIDVNKIIYFGSNDGYLYAFDLKTINPQNPQPKWVFNTLTRKIGKATRSSEKPIAAINSSPNIDDDGTIIFSSNSGYLFAVKPDGTLKWDPFYIDMSWNSPAIHFNGTIHVGSWNDRIAYPCLDKISIDDPGCTETYDASPSVDVDNASVTVPSYISYYIIDKEIGVLENFMPRTTCTPGGIFASPVIAPNGDTIISWFKTFDTWELEDYCDTTCTDKTTWRLGLGRCLPLTSEDIYSTPAMIEDNSFFAVSGPNVLRIMPDGANYYSVATLGDRSESSPAVDGQKNVFLGSNGGYFYALCADCPQTPKLWQYPGEGEEPLQIVNVSGTKTIASIVSSPAIGDDIRHSVYVGASDGSVYAFYDGVRIAGKVTEESTGQPIQAVKITLTSIYAAQDRVEYTDTNGNYVFSGVENYTYTVTPEKIGYVFTPQQRTAVIKQDQDSLNINFTAFDGFTLTGKVIDSKGSPVQSVVVSIEGENTQYTATATTNSNGEYSFTGLGYDTYTIIPALDGYGFDPPSQQKTITSDAATTAKEFTLNDFIAFKGYQISGVVLDVTKLEGQAGIQGVAITLSGSTTDGARVNLSKITDQEGKYSFTELSNGTYTVTPGSAIYNFEPESQNVTIASANALDINFYAGNGFAISGKIAKDSADADNATLASFMVELYKDNATIIPFSLSEKTPINTVNADSDGNFIFIGIPQGSYIVKPKREGYGFDPLFYSITIRTEPVSNLLFTAKKGLYIAGKVSNIIGIGQEGISIQIISNNTDTTTAVTTLTSQDGVYSFTGLNAGDYTIALSDDQKNYYQTFPESRNITLTSEGKEDINFVLNSYCSTVYFNIPFFGTQGTLVNIFGINFGWSEPPDNETLSVTMGDQTEEIPSGVYFGTNDLTTWTKAKVKIWSPIKIVVEAPESAMITPLNIVKVWVVRKNRNSEATATESEYAGCFDARSTDLFLYLY